MIVFCIIFCHSVEKEDHGHNYARYCPKCLLQEASSMEGTVTEDVTYIQQSQMHLFCSGATSALLLSILSLSI